MRSGEAAAILTAFALSIVVAGCATYGQDFEGSRIKDIQIDKTTRTEVEQMLGQPFQKQNPPAEYSLYKAVVQYLYNYSSASLFTATEAKALVVVFNDKDVAIAKTYVEGVKVLVKEVSTSAITVGSQFDSTRVKDIQNGKTTRAQIESWFGAPTTKTEPPPELKQKGVVLVYTYVHAHGGKSKSLVVFLDGKDVVFSSGYSEQ